MLSLPRTFWKQLLSIVFNRPIDWPTIQNNTSTPESFRTNFHLISNILNEGGSAFVLKSVKKKSGTHYRSFILECSTGVPCSLAETDGLAKLEPSEVLNFLKRVRAHQRKLEALMIHPSREKVHLPASLIFAFPDENFEKSQSSNAKVFAKVIECFSHITVARFLSRSLSLPHLL